jgi:serine/threonine-protein kinase
MELLEGETLAHRLASGALPLGQTLHHATQIADALAKAHRAGIVHRDLKPANVMLTKEGLKLLDFGLAKAAPPREPAAFSVATVTVPPPITARGAIAGTVQYMAPEQIEGRPADARSDIYAFGAVMYEMATGTRAFGSAPRPLSPKALDRIVCGCLAPDPDERWQSAHDVLLQLAAIDHTHAHVKAHRPGRLSWLPWIVSAGAMALAATLWLRVVPTASLPPQTVRLAIPPPNGGAPAAVLKADSAHKEARLNWPFFLPDGKRFLYLQRLSDGSGNLMFVDAGKAPREVMSVHSAVQYVEPGYIVFVQERALVGRRFDRCGAPSPARRFRLRIPSTIF